MNNTTNYFLHGLDSSGAGTKGRYLTEIIPGLIAPDFSGSLSDRLQQLEMLCRGQQSLILIGSSYGGLMATRYAALHPNQVARLVLLAPALNFEGYRPPPSPLSTPAYMVIGEHDQVTPPAQVLPLARATFSKLTVRIEDDDHLLHNSFRQLSWQQLVG